MLFTACLTSAKFDFGFHLRAVGKFHCTFEPRTLPCSGRADLGLLPEFRTQELPSQHETSLHAAFEGFGPHLMIMELTFEESTVRTVLLHMDIEREVHRKMLSTPCFPTRYVSAAICM